MLFKPNTVIHLAADFKENRVYMIDVTSEKIYSHFEDFSKIDTSGVSGYIGAMIILALSEWLRPQLYLNEPSQTLKIFLVIIGILAMVVFSWFIRKKIYTPQIEEYLQQHPQLEEVINVNDVLNKALFKSAIIIITFIGSLIGSIVLFNQFFDNSNLGNYIWAITVFGIFLYSTLVLKHAIFILKLTISMA